MNYQNNRLKSSQNYLTASSNLSDINTYATNKYNESFSYDANGNILNLERYNQTPSVMDNFSYNYYGMSNRLNWVDDPISAGLVSDDMDDQNNNNYAYDEIGQLTADVQEGLTGITWNVRNKVTRVDKAGIHDVDFEYDEMGQRVMKRSRQNNEDNWVETWYVRDAQGNTIATYEHSYTHKTDIAYNEHFRLNEHHIYGSSRLGIKNYSGYDLYSKNFNYAGSFLSDGSFDKNAITDEALVTLNWENYKLNQRKLGDKQYEIGNHLGNVMEVVSDYKIPVAAAVCTTGAQLTVDHYISDILSYTDYYPFGSLMPGRNSNSGDYAYGFQGQLIDNEIKGTGNSINFEYRMHDPRLGRFLSIDPLSKKYPFYSPYSFSGNRVIDCIEMEGLEPKGAFDSWSREGAPTHNYDNGAEITFIDGYWVYEQWTSANASAHNYYYFDQTANDNKGEWIKFYPKSQVQMDMEHYAIVTKGIDFMVKATGIAIMAPIALAEGAPLIFASRASAQLYLAKAFISSFFQYVVKKEVDIVDVAGDTFCNLGGALLVNTTTDVNVNSSNVDLRTIFDGSKKMDSNFGLEFINNLIWGGAGEIAGETLSPLLKNETEKIIVNTTIEVPLKAGEEGMNNTND